MRYKQEASKWEDNGKKEEEEKKKKGILEKQSNGGRDAEMEKGASHADNIKLTQKKERKVWSEKGGCMRGK